MLAEARARGFTLVTAESCTGGMVAAALTSILADVPVHVIPCIERRFDWAPLVVEATAYASIIPAAWSFLLALRSRGLGSVWTTLHLAKEREVAQLLGIPATVTQIALFPVAYTVGTDFKPAKRPPVESERKSIPARAKATPK